MLSVPLAVEYGVMLLYQELKKFRFCFAYYISVLFKAFGKCKWGRVESLIPIKKCGSIKIKLWMKLGVTCSVGAF